MRWLLYLPPPVLAAVGHGGWGQDSLSKAPHALLPILTVVEML